MKLEIGGGFLGTLTLIFVVFKLLGYIDWSWWLVFLPVLIGLGISILFLIGLLIFFIVVAIITGRD